MRKAGFILLIVATAAALQSDAQERVVPRRFVPPIVPVAAVPTSPELSPHNGPAAEIDPITRLPFSYGPITEVPAGRPPEAVEMFHCDFGRDWDANFDNWPDRWSRERSVDFPHYLPIAIADEAAALAGRQVANKSLRIDLNGGAAAVHTPPVAVDALYTYVAEACVRTEGLEHDEAAIALTFMDANEKPLQTMRSEPIRRTTGWTKVRIGPVAPNSAHAKHAVITLYIGPKEKADLRGSAWFSAVWLGRLPRMTLSADHRTHIYFDHETPVITCSASGFAEQHTKVVFELIDVENKVVQRSEVPLQPDASDRSKSNSSAPPQKLSSPVATEVNDLTGSGSGGRWDAVNGETDIIADTPVAAGTAVWEPRIAEQGFYRVRVEMPGKTDVANRRETTLAVLKRLPPRAAGEFGWSLPKREESLTLTELAEVISQSGCNWCKFPLWDERQPADRQEQLVWFAEMLGLRKIELVGLLSEPPEALQKQLFGREAKQAASVFSMPTEIWYPSLEPIMTRLSLKVRWWQLGLDKDQSFVGYPDLAAKIGQLNKQFTRYGQRVNLGMGWSWLRELPAEKPTWDFLALSAEPPLNWEEQILYLRATKDKGCQRWVVLEPLRREEYSLATRASDLVMRMIAAKMAGAEGVFLPQVFGTSTGVLNDDGTVGELFIPWRTAAHLLAGAKSLGSLQLPSNCRTEVFQQGNDVVMAVWSDQATSVELFLGDNARQIDLWGREKAVLKSANGVHALDVGPTPIFITGINAPLLRTQMSVQFENTKLASVFDQSQYNAITFKSYFPQSIRGRMHVVTPETWKISPNQLSFKTAAGETMYQQFEVALRQSATTGRQLLRLDFDVTADQRYQFSVYRQIEVGLSDIFLEAYTRLNENRELEVEQRLTNETDEVVSFKCYLYPPNRKRMMMHVEDHGRGVDVRTFRLYDGESLLGQTLLLRAEEINGSRILNYRVVAQP